MVGRRGDEKNIWERRGGNRAIMEEDDHVKRKDGEKNRGRWNESDELINIILFHIVI